MYKMVTKSDINDLITLNATYPALPHAILTEYSTGTIKVDKNPEMYRISLASFATENHLQNERCFSDHLLT